MRAVVWCNGQLPSQLVVDSVIDDGVSVFGVDGGADKAGEFGISVEEVLGDLDSVDRPHWKRGALRELPDQSSSDLSKSIEYLWASGYSEIDVIGIEGGNLGHALGAWASLVETAPEISVRMHFEDSVAHRVNNHSGEFRIYCESGEEFSVFALERSRITITGAKWELNDEEVGFCTLGLSNMGLGKEVAVKSNGTTVIISRRATLPHRT